MVRRSNTRARALVIISTTVVALVLLLATAVYAFTGPVPIEGTEHGTESAAEYRVRAGDTLWGIAADHTEPGGDVRHGVALIMELNDLEGSLIRAGEVLVVPALR
jgi:LysM repeat protein